MTRTNNKFEQHVAASRAIAGLVLMLCISFRTTLDTQVRSFWDWISAEWWFKHDSFEPVWATMCFSVWIMMFLVIDDYLQPTFSQFLINPKNRNPRNTYKDRLHWAAGTAYLVPIMIYDYYVPRRKLSTESPTFFQIFGGICLAVFLYDLFFYPIHLLLHKGPSFLRSLHKRHHKVSPLVSEEIIRHSLIDGTFQVATNILVLNLLKLHPLTRMIYNAVITYMLTESHSGYDMPWMLHNIVPGGVLGGPRRHEMHHKTGRANFHQFFTYLDDFFGFGKDFE